MARLGGYRLIAAGANRAIIVRRLLGLESVLSMGPCGPVHDERSWTFDLDPGEIDPVLKIRRLHQAYLAAIPVTRAGSRCPRSSTSRPGKVVTNDFPRIIPDLCTEWTAHHPPGAPALYPEPLRGEIGAIHAVVFTDVNSGVYRAGGRRHAGRLRTGLHRTVQPTGLAH